MSGLGLLPSTNGAWLVLTDGGPIRAASLVEAERILADVRAESWPTSGRGAAQALDCPSMPHPDPSRLVGAESVALF